MVWIVPSKRIRIRAIDDLLPLLPQDRDQVYAFAISDKGYIVKKSKKIILVGTIDKILVVKDQLRDDLPGADFWVFL